MWIGDRLGPIERACLRSVLRQAHRVALYCYREPQGIPQGVELRDASGILPEHTVFRHRNGSVAPFSDWFRYELLKRQLGTWIDTDMYLLAPLPTQQDYLFGQEKLGVLNNAVLRLPSNSPLWDELLSPFRGRTPYWLRPRYRIQSRFREWVVGSASVRSMPFGTTGPAALTAAAAKFDLLGKAEPPARFYPVPWERADWILDPSQPLEAMVSNATVGIHLWNECIRRLQLHTPPPNSFLARLYEEGA
jgi:hypothetical protein